jgi:hypothetical protein
MRRLSALLAVALFPLPTLPSVDVPATAPDRSERQAVEHDDAHLQAVDDLAVSPGATTGRLRAQLHQAVDRGELDLAESLLRRLRGAQGPQCLGSPIGATGCSPKTAGGTATPGHTGGLNWVFGVPLYVVDVAEMEAHNAALTAIIKEQFETLDAAGWAADRTYVGAAKPVDELEPADRNDEFVSYPEPARTADATSFLELRWLDVHLNICLRLHCLRCARSSIGSRRVTLRGRTVGGSVRSAPLRRHPKLAR